jgi:hypothetical protein
MMICLIALSVDPFQNNAEDFASSCPLGLPITDVYGIATVHHLGRFIGANAK